MLLIKILFAFLLLSPAAKAADLFSVTLTQNGKTATQQFTSVEDAFNKFKNGQLDSILAGYNKKDSAVGTVDFRGIKMNLDYTTSTNNITGETTSKLTFNAPALGITKTFGTDDLSSEAKVSQDQAFNEFKEYLKQNKDNLLTNVLKESVSNTPYDSVAGNPNSLMSQMSDLAMDNPTLSATDHANESGQGNMNDGFVMLSPSGGQHSVKGPDGTVRTAKTANLPLGYTFKFKNNWALGIDLPLSYTDLEGSITYAAQLGLSLQVPFYKDKWLVTFSGRAGGTASKDTVSGGILYMASASSRFTQKVGSKTKVTLVNMYGYVQDYTLNVKQYNIKYGLKNNVFKNGLEIHQKLSEKTAITIMGFDTRFTGSDLYVDAYDEVGVRLTRYFTKKSFFTGIDFSGCYIFGKNYKAYNAGVSLLF